MIQSSPGNCRAKPKRNQNSVHVTEKSPCTAVLFWKSLRPTSVPKSPVILNKEILSPSNIYTPKPMEQFATKTDGQKGSRNGTYSAVLGEAPLSIATLWCGRRSLLASWASAWFRCFDPSFPANGFAGPRSYCSPPAHVYHTSGQARGRGARVCLGAFVRGKVNNEINGQCLLGFRAGTPYYRSKGVKKNVGLSYLRNCSGRL